MISLGNGDKITVSVDGFIIGYVIGGGVVVGKAYMFTGDNVLFEATDSVNIEEIYLYNLDNHDINYTISIGQGTESGVIGINKGIKLVGTPLKSATVSNNGFVQYSVKNFPTKSRTDDYGVDGVTIEINSNNELKVKDGIFEKQSNKVNLFQSTPDNNHYPSEKLVKDELDKKMGVLDNGVENNILTIDFNGQAQDSGYNIDDFTNIGKQDINKVVFGLLGNIADAFFFPSAYGNRPGNNNYNFFIKNTATNNPVRSFNDEGILGRCVLGNRNQKMELSVPIDLNTKSFFIAGWWKITKADPNNNDDGYIIGNNNTGGTNQALHIGWRNDNTFTVAFYADDINIAIQDGYKFSDIKNKWTHIVINHEQSTKKSTVWINGVKIGEGTHNDYYKSNLTQLFGARNQTNTQGKLSNLRIYISNGDITGISDSYVQSLYSKELKYLEQIFD